MFNLNSLASLSLAQLKTMAAEHGIIPTGDKRKAITWATAIFDRMEEIAKASKAKVWSAGQGFGKRTAKAIKGLKVALKSPKAIENYTRILSITRYLGEQLAQGCELGLRATVWAVAYAVTAAAWLVEQSLVEATWSPIDRADIVVQKLPSSEMLERLPMHGPALHAEENHQAAVALNEPIAQTDRAMVKMTKRAKRVRKAQTVAMA